MMDYKQRNIFNKICERNNIPKKNTFVQHRNLNEFRGFIVERINPTHKMHLYGKLKKKYIKDGNANKIIRVGEIFVYSACFMVTDPLYMQIFFNILGGLILYYVMFNIILDNKVGEIVNACWYRRECRNRENSIRC